MPTATRVYTTLCEEWDALSGLMSAASYLEQQSVESEKANTVEKCLRILSNPTTEHQVELKEALWANPRSNVPFPKENEDFWSFVQRRAQRNPATISTRRTSDRIERMWKKQRKGRKHFTERDKRRHLDKHGK